MILSRDRRTRPWSCFNLDALYAPSSFLSLISVDNPQSSHFRHSFFTSLAVISFRTTSTIPFKITSVSPQEHKRFIKHAHHSRCHHDPLPVTHLFQKPPSRDSKQNIHLCILQLSHPRGRDDVDPEGRPHRVESQRRDNDYVCHRPRFCLETNLPGGDERHIRLQRIHLCPPRDGEEVFRRHRTRQPQACPQCENRNLHDGRAEGRDQRPLARDDGCQGSLSDTIPLMAGSTILEQGANQISTGIPTLRE